MTAKAVAKGAGVTRPVAKPQAEGKSAQRHSHGVSADVRVQRPGSRKG